MDKLMSTAKHGLWIAMSVMLLGGCFSVKNCKCGVTFSDSVLIELLKGKNEAHKFVGDTTAGINLGFGSFAGSVYGIDFDMFAGGAKQLNGIGVCSLGTFGAEYMNGMAFTPTICLVDGGNGAVTSFFASIANDFNGLMISSLINIADRGSSVIQIGFLTLADKGSRALQFGALNCGRDNSAVIQVGVVNKQTNASFAVSIGLLNISHNSEGVQLGLINFMDDWLPIPILRFHTRCD